METIVNDEGKLMTPTRFLVQLLYAATGEYS